MNPAIKREGTHAGIVFGKQEMLSRRKFIGLTAASGLAGILYSGCAPAVTSARRNHNIFFVTIDALRADHGESLGENDYYFEHGMLVNEGSIRIPLIISHPETREHLAIRSLLQSTDLAPTILTETGSTFSTEIDGIDFSGLYRDHNPDGQIRDFIYSCTPP